MVNDEWTRRRVDQVVREALALLDDDLSSEEIVTGVAMHLLSDVDNNPSDYQRKPTPETLLDQIRAAVVFVDQLSDRELTAALDSGLLDRRFTR